MSAARTRPALLSVAAPLVAAAPLVFAMSCYPCSIGLAAKALLALFIEESNPKFSTILHDKHVKRLFLCQPLLQNLLNSTSISQLMKHLFHGC
jgi:hypothetical protein